MNLVKINMNEIIVVKIIFKKKFMEKSTMDKFKIFLN